MSNRTELSYYSFPQLFDVTNICLELSETTELYKTMKRNISYVVFKKNTQTVRGLSKHYLRVIFCCDLAIRSLIKITVMIPRKAAATLILKCSVQCCNVSSTTPQLLLSSITLALSIRAFRQSILRVDRVSSARSQTSGLLLILAQFLARHLRVKISHALREVTV